MLERNLPPLVFSRFTVFQIGALSMNCGFAITIDYEVGAL
jgi:hypothetical protein